MSDDTEPHPLKKRKTKTGKVDISKSKDEEPISLLVVDSDELSLRIERELASKYIGTVKLFSKHVTTK